LARREHSRAELTLFLAKKSFPSNLVRLVLDELQNQGLISDQRFAEVYARSRVARGCGPRRIQQELQQKRVEDAIIRAVLEQSDADWDMLAERVRVKRFGRSVPKDVRERAKQWRFLLYKGFNPEHIRIPVVEDLDAENIVEL
jgi:regulatory protein